MFTRRQAEVTVNNGNDPELELFDLFKNRYTQLVMYVDTRIEDAANAKQSQVNFDLDFIDETFPMFNEPTDNGISPIDAMIGYLKFEGFNVETDNSRITVKW